MTHVQGRGSHGGRGGVGPAYFDPWTVYSLNPEESDACKAAHKRVIGAGDLSTGTGGLLLLGVLAWLVFEADKRVPR